MKILITGIAGFIGMNVAEKLLQRGDAVVGIDNLNSYYDVDLKKSRLKYLSKYENINFHYIDIVDKIALEKIFATESPQRVIHLAAQAGVRHSINNPQDFMDSNLQGFLNILEASRHVDIEHLVYASSSSVYGGNKTLPFAETQSVNYPISFYAATKRSNELMAHTYSHVFNLPTTGLRFFTAYGPWGRPDMALFLFANAIMKDKPIDIFNYGEMTRDFTYIHDIATAVLGVVDKVPGKNVVDHLFEVDLFNDCSAPYKIFNVGNGQPVPLMEYISALEDALGKKSIKNYLPMQPGDVQNTSADISKLAEWIGFKPEVDVKSGVKKFADWYLSYYVKKCL